MKFVNRLTLLIVLGVCITTALPIAAAISFAREQALDRKKAYVTELAQSALARSEETSDQLLAGSRQVNRLSREQICSDAGLDLMRRIDLGSTLLQGVGHIEGDVMTCSSFGGRHAFNLGPANLVQRTGVRIRTDVRLLDPKLPYLAVASGNFIGIVHKDLPLSFVDHVPGLKITTFSWSRRVPLLSRGKVAQGLIASATNGDAIFRDGDDVVAIVRSKRFDIGAVASLPIGQSVGLVGERAFIFIPIGIIAGLLLSALLVHAVRTRISMPMVIRSALKAEEFYLEYQPVVDLSTGRTVGAEALVRWRRSRGDLIPPDIFVPAAEQAGIIPMITARVLELLAKDVPDALRVSPDFHFAVNFSAADMHRPDILDELLLFMARSGMNAHNFVVEATERCFVNVDLARETMRKMRSIGIKVAIDDFGTGYSSLGYLAQLEVDYLKIDKLFIQSLGTDAATSQVAGRIIDMAKDLKLGIVAEGIETPQQERLLKGMRVEYAQGYFYGLPMSIEELLQHMRAERRVVAVRPRRKAA